MAKKPTPANNEVYRQIAEEMNRILLRDYNCSFRKVMIVKRFLGIPIDFESIESYLIRKRGQALIKMTRAFFRSYEKRWLKEMDLSPEEKYEACRRYFAGFPPHLGQTAGYIVWCEKYEDLIENVYLRGKANWSKGCQEHNQEQKDNFKLLVLDRKEKLA